MNVLEVKNLTTYIKTRQKTFKVVDNVSFSLTKGKTLALVGESGCGKTMTALSLTKILPTPPVLPPTGQVLYKGKNLLALASKQLREIRGKNIAMIFQDPMSSLNPVYTIGYQLMEMLNIHLDLYEEEAYQKVIQALEEVGISNPKQRFDAYPHQLSGGMKQRVMIAMAMICKPDILIADEPTTALDVTIQAQILDLMKKLQKEKGTAILLITHDLGVVSKMADDVIVMYASQIVEKAQGKEIFKNRAHPYTRGLFKSIPPFEKKSSRLPTIKGSVPPLTKLPSGCLFHPRCPYVMNICRKGSVPQFAIGSNENKKHLAKCWLYQGEKA